jgi:hypothetical protein
VSRETPRTVPDTGSDRPEPAAVSLGPDDPAWDRAGWLDGFREIAPDATWPRVMTVPHPAAVGSYGAELATWSGNRGVQLRYWQRLAATRLLEHDADGNLVWPWWLLTTARQVGKSWALRELLLWRIHQGERFGEPQTVVHTGKDLAVCREVQRPARAWARNQAHYTVREANGQEEIETPDGSRWMIRGKTSIYGYSASLGAVDEAWKVLPEVVEDGLEPTMAERASAQLGLVSTAHRMATALMPTRRNGALEQLLDPTDVLIMEWSAPRDAELGDRDAWRQASPYWSVRRERLISAQHERALVAGPSDDPDEPDPVESFRSQWLNIWPVGGTIKSGRIEALLDEGVWDRLTVLSTVPAGALALAIADNFGRGAAAVAAGHLPDGRAMVWGAAFPSRDQAWAWVELTNAAHPGSTLLTEPGLDADPAGARIPVANRQPVGPQATRQGLALIRALANTGKLAHDGSRALADQVAAARVTPSASGGLSSAGAARADLVRATAWALQHAMRAPEPAAPKFFVR